MLEMVGVTSIEKTYFFEFAFQESEKMDNVTLALDVCRAMLKGQDEMPKVIITHYFLASVLILLK